MMGNKSILEKFRTKIQGLELFLNDASRGMVFPIIPLFLLGALSSPALLIGLAESIPQFLSSLIRFFPASLAKNKLFRAFSLTLSTAMRPLLFASNSFNGFLSFCSIDSAANAAAFPTPLPHPLSIKTIIHIKNYGGILLGPILALLLLFFFANSPEEDSYRSIFLLSAIPASLALIPLLIKKENKYSSENSQTKPSSLSPKAPSHPQLFSPQLITSSLFLISKIGILLFLLKAAAVLPPPFIILAYIIFISIHAALSFPAQLLLDTLGQKKTFIIGCIIFSMAALSFSLPQNMQITLALFAFLGASSSLLNAANTQEKIPLAGKYPILSGAFLILANIIAGLLWDFHFAQMHAPFLFSCALSLISVFAFSIHADREE